MCSRGDGWGGAGMCCVSTGQGESIEATGARCDDRRSLGLKIELCSQHHETEERKEEEEEEEKGMGKAK